MHWDLGTQTLGDDLARHIWMLILGLIYGYHAR